MLSSPFAVAGSGNVAVQSILARSAGADVSGISVIAGSVMLNASAAEAVNLYDGSLYGLGIGAGLLMTTGTTPGTSNTAGWFGQDNANWAGVLDPVTGLPTNFYNGSASIDAVVNTVFQTQSYDASTLAFDFTVNDPKMTSISFDLVFGSEEYPEWVDQFVDCAVVKVNGVNYALFNHDPNSPLSVIGSNLSAGYFQDNAGNVLPIEYDGVSRVLKIIAPVNAGQVNHIEIGIADTGDHIYDSGIFIANLQAGTTPGSGVLEKPPTDCTDGDDSVTGSLKDDLFELKGGNDTAYAGGGDDIVVAGAGNDLVYGGSGNDVLEGDAGNDTLDGGDGTGNEAVYAGPSSAYSISFDAVSGHYTVVDSSGAEGIDTLSGIQLLQFGNGLFDLGHSGGQGTLTPHVVGPVQPNTPGAVVITGITMAGSTLTAVVVDPDGAPASSSGVTYQWQTSANGVSWTSVGTGSTYVVPDGAAGQSVKVTAGYTDGHGTAEAPTSAAVTIVKANAGVTILPMEITAPAGAWVMDPFTTLIQNATSLGYTTNQAYVAVKAAFGFDSIPGLAQVDLAKYDALAVLNANPNDAAALAFLKLEAEVAMTASVSDPTGMNMTLAVLNAATSGHTLDLTSLTDLSSAGVGASALTLVQGLNIDMRDAGDLATVNLVWNDWAGQQDQLKPFLGHIDAISVHINQAPAGFGPDVLPDAQANAGYVLLEADLLANFSDPEGDPLSIAAITTDQGNLFVNNLDGTWTLTPPNNYVGPLEVSYTVTDGNGGSTGASVLLIVQPSTVLTLADPAPISLTDTTAADTFPTVTGDLSVGVSNATGQPSYGITGGTEAGGVATLTGQYGTLSVDAQTGAYWFTPNSAAVEGLKTAAAEVYQVTVSDGSSVALASLNIGITGTDDPTTFGGVATGAVTEDATLTAGGTLTATDRDIGDSVFTAQTKAAGTYGSFSITSAGVWSYTLNNSAANVQALVAGQTVSDTFKVVTAGGATRNVVISINGANDGLTGTAGNDSITGTAGNDLIDGLAGNDTLKGGAGNDTLTGGTGLDTLLADAGTDTVTDLGNGGADVLVVSAGATASATISAAWTATAATSNSGVASIVTSAKAVNLAAVTGGSAGFNVTNTGAATTLTGSALADTLTGGIGNDSLLGGGGNDVMTGGAGLDTFTVAAGTDTITDLGNGGADVLKVSAGATANATLAAAWTATSSTANSGTANLTSNGLAVNLAAVTTGSGYSVTNIGVATTLTGSGLADVLNGGIGADTLIGGAGNDTLTGAAGNDSLTGGTGLDTFAVTAGADTITDLGAGGADVLVVSAGATASATIGAAWTATVATSNSGVANLTTSALAVNLAAVTGGSAGFNVTNTGAATTLTGSALADTLTGGIGNDSLLGGGGNDVMTGGAGLDTFTVAVGTDTITDLGNGGADVLKVSAGATANATLAAAWTATSSTANSGSANLSSNGLAVNLAAVTTGSGYSVTNTGAATTLTGSGLADVLNGGLGADTLIGGAGNDTLTGAAGNDSLTGGTGLDTFAVTAGADTITDLGTGGADVLVVSAGATATATIGAAWTATVATSNSGIASIVTSAKAVNLAAVTGGSAGFNVTNIGAATTLTGSALADKLAGGTGNDTLVGGAGADWLTGGLGNDALTGGLGADVFVFSAAPSATTNKDTITDFTHAEDLLSLSKAVFTGLTTAVGAGAEVVLDAGEFVSSATATSGTSATSHIVYNTTTGALYYDADGNGAGAAVQLAVLGTTAHPVLTFSDIHVFG